MADHVTVRLRLKLTRALAEQLDSVHKRLGRLPMLPQSGHELTAIDQGSCIFERKRLEHPLDLIAARSL